MKMKKTKMANSVNKDPRLISICVSSGRIRIKFRKILAKSNHKAGSQTSENGQKIRKKLRKGIGSIISSACGNRNGEEMLEHTSDDEQESIEEKDTGIFQEDELALTNIDEEGSHENGDDEKHKKQTRKVSGQSLLKSSSFTRIFRKSNGFHFEKWKKVKTAIRNLDIRGKKAGEKLNDEGEDDRRMELCKKRILMGEKCRPLNVSGVLHYNQAGILLPEDFIQNE